jgi:hypothetical protein
VSMTTDESALVPVSPDDTIDSIIAKVRGTGATTIELLVPDNTAALQSPGGFERLRRAFDVAHVGLLVISSDEQTLDAARLSRIETVGVQGVRVTVPARTNGGPADRYATRVLPAAPIDERDAEFLDALDQVPADDRYADLDADDADLYSALDDLSDTMQEQGPARRSPRGADNDLGQGEDEDFAAALDDWDDYGDDQSPTLSSRVDPDRDRDPSRRFSPADFDLSDDDRRQRGGRGTTARRGRAETKAVSVRDTAALRRPGATTGRLREYDEEDAAAPRRGLSRSLIPLAIVLAIVLILVFWLLNSRVTIAVAPPVSAAGEHPFKNEVIPLAQAGESVTTAIQAAPVIADAEASVNGQVQKETISPAGTAKGTVTIINTIESAVPIPKGAEFIGKNPRGEDVRFTLDADAVVPAAVTSSSTSGRSTTYGQIVVAVTARSPGSASNVDTNSIKQIVIPGQQPIVSDSSNFLIRHDPIGGGSEAPQRIVTDADVQAVLGEALTALYNNGVQQLRSKIDESKLGIDGTTIMPSTTDLADPKNYQPPVVEPAVGQAVDPANPIFKVTVRARFNALATPSGKPVADQLQIVAPQYFHQRSEPPCKVGEQQVMRVDRSRWDGTRLTIDGAINCLPAEGLSPDAIAQVKRAVNGQSHDAAEEGLQSLQEHGVIGSYKLPDKAQFPSFDWLIDVQVDRAVPMQAQPTASPPAQPQPTQGTQ